MTATITYKATFTSLPDVRDWNYERALHNLDVHEAEFDLTGFDSEETNYGDEQSVVLGYSIYDARKRRDVLALNPSPDKRALDLLPVPFTVWHELAHTQMGHTTLPNGIAGAMLAFTEAEAQLVAIRVLEKLELDKTSLAWFTSKLVAQRWIEQWRLPQPPQEVAERIEEIAQKIYEAGLK